MPIQRENESLFDVQVKMLNDSIIADIISINEIDIIYPQDIKEISKYTSRKGTAYINRMRLSIIQSFGQYKLTINMVIRFDDAMSADDIQTCDLFAILNPNQLVHAMTVLNQPFFLQNGSNYLNSKIIGKVQVDNINKQLSLFISGDNEQIPMITVPNTQYNLKY